MPTVGFKLRFTRPTRPDGRTAARRGLTDQMGPHTGQAGEKILILSQLNLKFSFTRSGTLRKDIQDEAGTIQNFDPEIFGQNPHLRG